jgi:nucleoside permease NupC
MDILSVVRGIFSFVFSIAILIGIISEVASQRQRNIGSLDNRVVSGGSSATLMTATIAGILLG